MWDPADPCRAGLVDVTLRITAEFDFDRPLRARHLPGVAIAQPFVRFLDLPAVDDLLLEDAELITDSIAEGGDLQRRHRIQEAGRETAEAAVPESRLVLAGEHLIEIQIELGHGLAHLVVDAEIHQIVAEVRPHEELGGKVGDRARTLGGIRRSGAYPALQHPVSHGIGERHVVVVLSCECRSLALHAEEIVEEGVLEGVFAQRDAIVLRSVIRGRSQGTHIHVLLPAWARLPIMSRASSVQMTRVTDRKGRHVEAPRSFSHLRARTSVAIRLARRLELRQCTGGLRAKRRRT